MLHRFTICGIFATAERRGRASKIGSSGWYYGWVRRRGGWLPIGDVCMMWSQGASFSFFALSKQGGVFRRKERFQYYYAVDVLGHLVAWLQMDK